LRGERAWEEGTGVEVDLEREPAGGAGRGVTEESAEGGLGEAADEEEADEADEREGEEDEEEAG
jgi:hypothetical protein